METLHLKEYSSVLLYFPNLKQYEQNLCESLTDCFCVCSRYLTSLFQSFRSLPGARLLMVFTESYIPT